MALSVNIFLPSRRSRKISLTPTKENFSQVRRNEFIASEKTNNAKGRREKNMVMETDGATPGASAKIGSLKGPLAYAISCFFIWGLAYGLLDVLNKHFQESLHVGKAQSTFLQIAYFGAYLTLSIPAGMLLRRAGYKIGILTGLCLTAFGAFLFIPAAGAASFPLFVGSMF